MEQSQSEMALVEEGEASDAKSEAKHWVHDLFPPMFGYSERELLEGSELLTEEGLMGSKNRIGLSNKNSEDLFFQLAQVMSEADAASIRNVYRRVWVLRKLREKQLTAAGATTNSPTAGEASEKNKEQALLSASATTTAKIAPSATNIQKPTTIWTADELEILRREFRATKDANQSLTSEIELLKEQLKSHKSMEAAWTSELNETKSQLNEARKANARFQILAQNLKKTLDQEMRVSQSLREERKKLRERVQENQSKAVEVQKELRKESAKCQRQESRLKAECSNVEQRCEEVAERVRRDWVGRVHSLEDRLKQVMVELEVERQAHQRASRGLERLRVHFSSMPLSVIEGSPEHVGMEKEKKESVEKQKETKDLVKVVGLMLNNIVSKDEITEWTY